jgi:hypothetical protein
VGNKGDDVKDSFCEEVGRVIDQFPRYDMNILLCGFSAKVGRENIFKLTIRNNSIHEINGVRVVNFATSKNLVVKNTTFQHCRILNTPGLLLAERCTSRLIMFF